MAPSTQKALLVPEPQAEWKLVDNWPVPTIGPNDVLVKNLVAAVNPADYKIQAAPAIPFIQFPFIGGLDGAGIVEEVGSEVTNVAKGDKIVYPGGFEHAHATFKEYSVVPAENTAKIPDNITLEQAATIPVALATVATGTWPHDPQAESVSLTAPWEEGGLTKYAGKAAFIVGGASSVGQFAIQMAKLQNFSPIIVTASPRHEAYLKSLGATHVIDRSLASDAILAELPKLTGGKPIVYAYDTISDEDTQHLAYDALASDGGLVLTSPQTVQVLAQKVERDGGSKKIARPFASYQLPFNRAVGKEVFAHLTEWLKTGVIVPNKVEVIPSGLLGVKEACRRYREGKVSGVKLIVHVA